MHQECYEFDNLSREKKIMTIATVLMQIYLHLLETLVLETYSSRVRADTIAPVDFYSFYKLYVYIQFWH